MTASTKKLLVPEAPPVAPSWTTSHAMAALAEAVSTSKASPPLLNSARASLATLQAAMGLCGLNSTPSASARGCTAEDAFLTIASVARSLLKPNKAGETARLTLGCAFSTAHTALANIGAVRHV